MVNQVNNSNQIRQSESVRNSKQNYNKTYSGNDLKFEALLKEQLNKPQPLQMSKHAQERMEQRGITVTKELMENLTEAVDKARVKGAKDMVAVVEAGIFIVNIPNSIVVTMMSGKEGKSNIITNIDSAVIL